MSGNDSWGEDDILTDSSDVSFYGSFHYNMPERRHSIAEVKIDPIPAYIIATVHDGQGHQIEIVMSPFRANELSYEFAFAAKESAKLMLEKDQRNG